MCCACYAWLDRAHALQVLMLCSADECSLPVVLVGCITSSPIPMIVQTNVTYLCVPICSEPYCAMQCNAMQADIVTEVNESILGGLQVMVGDRFLDLSVSSRVASLSASLESAAN